MQKIEVGGMQIDWHFEGQYLVVDVTAPDNGWVGIGFNPSNDIVNTNLIMAGVREGKPYLSERFVVGIGDHRSVSQLGGSVVAKLMSAEEKPGSTHICFSMPIKSLDRYHYNLSPSQELFFICAFSMEDDLNHHSRMRQHVKVKL